MITYPTSLDTFAARLVVDLEDALQAVEAKVGIDGSAVTSSLDYKVSETLVHKTGTELITGVKTIQSSGAAAVALIVKAVASQSADLQQWQDSGGVVQSRIMFHGVPAVALIVSLNNTGSAIALNGVTAEIVGRDANGTTLIVTGAPSQSVSLQEWRNSGGTALFSVTAAGLPKWNVAANVQTTVGAAGGASAPPATPTKYLKVVGDNGTTYVVPAYAAA